MNNRWTEIRLRLQEQFRRFYSFLRPVGGGSLGQTAWGAVRRHWALGLALMAGIAAFFMTQSYAERQVLMERDRLLPKGGLVEVLVAARNLSAGDVVGPLTVAIRRMPQDWSGPEVLTPLDFDTVNQRKIVRPIKAGYPIMADHLRQSAVPQSGAVVEPGFRAVSIAVDEVSSVAGLIQPGDRIDLWANASPVSLPAEGAIVSLSADRLAPSTQARLIAENLRVIATGAKTERSSESPTESRAPSANDRYSTLTLAVPAGLAHQVLTGQLQGRLGVALRAPEREGGQLAGPTRQGPKTAIHHSGPIEILIGSAEGVAR
jgi:pilus assembly protein CpaB